eukprot:11381503-Karenia_brevis.AAC.1
MASHLLETVPAESQEFAALLSPEQLERVMKSFQHAYESEILPGIANAFPSIAPADYVQMNFTEHLNKKYTRMP